MVKSLSFAKSFLLFSLFLISLSVHADRVDDSKKIEKITVRGLVKHSPSLVRSYLPVREGDFFSQAAMKDVVRSLFASDFFRDIKIYQNGTELVVKLVERPWIANIVVSGNKLIKSEELTTILESQNITENRAFNKEKFSQMVAELESLYYLQGYYGVKISVNTEVLDNERVSLKIDIYEGDITRIAKINIIGNQVYQQKDLLQLFQIRTIIPDELFNGNDSYVKASLEGDLQKLSDFYQNRGYARFRFLDRKVSLLANKAAVLINVHVEEGQRYHFGTVAINGYEKALTQEEVETLLLIKTGEVFSRENLIKSVDNVRKAIQSHGYAFVQVNPIVRLQDDTQQAFVNLQVNVGKRVYVRRVIISGNNTSLDEVLRVEMRQFEQALYIPKKVELSKQRLNRLGFFSQVDINHVQVNEQQVDLIVRVNEQRTGSFNLKLGYSPQSGAIYQMSVAENNWLGRGYTMKLSLDLQENAEAVNLGYTNRHFFEDEVSFSWDGSYSQTRDTNISANSYQLNQQKTDLTLGIPANENIRFNYGFGLAREELSCGTDLQVCQTFINGHGQTQESASLIFLSNIDLRNRGFLPSAGSLHNLSLRTTVPGSALFNYSLNLKSQFYGALTRSERSTVRLRLATDIIQGYNGSSVPFYKKLFVGGAHTVRGFSASSLGPSYDIDVDGVSGFKGGNLRSYANLDFYIALDEVDEFSETDDNFRFNIFVDTGYAFEQAKDFSVDSFRSSAGLGWVYFSPIGVITLYYGVPISQSANDQLNQFGFLLGTAL